MSGSSSPSTTRSGTGSSWSASRRRSPGRWLQPAGRDHRVRPPVPGRAGRARGLPVLEHALQRPGVRLDRRRRLPHAHRSRAPQARRLPRRANRAVPHELPGRHHRRRVQELAFPGRPRGRDRDGPRRHPQSTAIFLYFLGPEGFTYEYSFGVRRIEDEAAWVPRTFDPDEPGSIDMWLGPSAAVPSPSCQSEPAGRSPNRPATAAAARNQPSPNPSPPEGPHDHGHAGQFGVAGVPTALIDTGPSGAAGRRPARAVPVRVRPGRDRHRELAPGDPGAERRTAA